MKPSQMSKEELTEAVAKEVMNFEWFGWYLRVYRKPLWVSFTQREKLL